MCHPLQLIFFLDILVTPTPSIAAIELLLGNLYVIYTVFIFLFTYM